MSMNDFYLYVRSFYGTDGLYPMGANLADIIAATDIYLSRLNTRFEGDSFDREEVRDILIASFRYEWPSVARATDEDDDIVSELNFEEEVQ
jgi:hypothetical protein